MKRSCIFRIIPIFLFVLLLAPAALSGCNAKKEVFTAEEKSFAPEQLYAIFVDADRANVTVSDADGEFIVVRYSDSSAGHYSIQAADGTLSITRTSEDNASLNLSDEEAKLEIMIPSLYRGSLDITSALGDVTLESGEFLNVQLRADVGEVTLDHIAAETFALTVGTGNLWFFSIMSNGDITAEVAAGDINGSVYGYASDFRITATSKRGVVSAPEGSASAAKKAVFTTDSGSIDVSFS